MPDSPRAWGWSRVTVTLLYPIKEQPLMNTRNYILAVLALCVGILSGSALAVMGSANAHVGTSNYSPVITWISNRPCREEDSVNCAWNAQEQGNGVGHSFIVRHFPGTRLTCIQYDAPRYSRHDYCLRAGVKVGR